MIGLVILTTIVALICWWARGAQTAARRFACYLAGGFFLLLFMVTDDGDCRGGDCGLAWVGWILTTVIIMLGGILVSEGSLRWTRRR